MESRDRLGEASGASEAKNEEKIDGQGESEAKKGQALIADLMEILGV